MGHCMVMALRKDPVTLDRSLPVSRGAMFPAGANDERRKVYAINKCPLSAHCVSRDFTTLGTQGRVRLNLT